MKVCEKCGAINNNERFFCADCGEKLPSPVSKAYETEINGRISDTGDKLMRESDPLAVTTFDRITGFVSVGGLLLSVVLLFVGSYLQKFNPELILCSMLFFALGIVTSFFPRMLWFFEKIHLSFTISDSEKAEPSDWYLFWRKAGNILLCIFGVSMLLISVMGV